MVDLMRRDGFVPLRTVRSEMDRALEELLESFEGAPAWGWGAREFPALNLWENEGNFYVEAELPGLSMQDVEVLVAGNELTLRGKRPDLREEDVAYHRRERGAGEFSRTVRLPLDVDVGAVAASLAQGVLTVTLPKAPAARPRKIEVQQKQ